MDNVRSVNEWFLCLPRRAKQSLMVASDLVALPIVLWLAFVLRLETLQPAISHPWLLLAAPLLTIPVLGFLGIYKMMIRHIGGNAVLIMFVGMSIATALLAATVYLFQALGTPRSVFGIYWALGLLYLAGGRYVVSRYLNRFAKSAEAKKVVIYGAGSSGIQLVTALVDAAHNYRPVAFVDDDVRLQGMQIFGLPVRPPAELAEMVRRGEVDKVLLAIPSASRAQRSRIVKFLEPLEVMVKTIPGLTDLVSGKAQIQELREVAVDDLLGRDAVPPDAVLLSSSISGKRVLVTGAGGSIGSELCRQIMLLKPETLVLVEHNECGLYEIEKELHGLPEAAQVRVVAVLGSVLTRGLVADVARKHGVQTLFHAAAYKHVPMVETNPAAGARNNILGTWEVARGAQQAGVARCILVSTDKAVRPTNVMGASKRFAELILQALAAQPGTATVFSMVRFGNVLGSSGSVVPLFRQQIAAGGPVTVTHPDVIRYFMTIPEAAQLVIQAGAMAKGGEVFLLDMGQPVRIRDLAESMIRLMGLSVRDDSNPDGDIAIEYTGLRPGEKLYEELLIGDDPLPTNHPMIMQAREDCLPLDVLETGLHAMGQAVEQNDSDRIRALLRSYVIGYKPAGVDALDDCGCASPPVPEADDVADKVLETKTA